MVDKDILVVKVGSSTLTKRSEQGLTSLDVESFERIGEQLQEQHRRGNGIILVSSAAVAAGMAHTGTTERPDKTTDAAELRRLASIGWRHVLNQWSESLGELNVGELLVTRRDMASDDKTNELLRTMGRLLAHDDLCIVNENDAVAGPEATFGDNDTLAASLAARTRDSALFDSCVKLLILSDVDGVYRDKDEPGTLLRTIDDIDQCRHLAGATTSIVGTGGMHTKFVAASLAKAAGVETWIGHGRTDNVIAGMLNGDIGTHFML